MKEAGLTARTRRVREIPLTRDVITDRLRELERGRSIPSSWYLDAGVLEMEKCTLFRPAWHYVGHTEQVHEPGRFFTCSVMDAELVVAHGADGKVRAFRNVCRHRGARVVRESCGKRNTFQCHYHAWTYALDGSLRAAPRSDREPGFRCDDFPLHQVAVDSWGPFLFVNLERKPEPLTAALGTLPERVAEVGIDVERMRFHTRVEYDLACDWKVAIENFLECYHCAVAHPEFSRLLNVDPASYRTVDSGGRFTTQRAPVRSAAVPEEEGWEVRNGQYHVLWPGMKLNIHPGHPNLSIGPVFPTGVGRSFGYLDYFFGEGVAKEWIQERLAFDDRVGREDTELIESVQAGLSSDTEEGSGRLFLASEDVIAAFHRHILESFRAEVSSSAGSGPG
jgi:phenylpropionate dioxygenase-like ring-hydroxylating dioxygenase large terminal subunit